MLPNKVLLTNTQIVYFYIFDIVSFCFLFVDVSTPIVILLKDDKSRFCCNFSYPCSRKLRKECNLLELSVG